jgi:serine/threonine-protein kinase
VIDDTLGRYRITRKLGEGGMGVVYSARDDQLQRDIAIKVLSASLLHDPTARARLLREARAAAALNHPNICTIHEVGEDNDQVYIAMELVEGAPLSAHLESRRLTYDEVLHIGRQVADALGHAHERGIVHRDLKALNVMVMPNGRCKVLDFGLATRFDQVNEETARTMLTATGDLLGTPAYMAPERFQFHPADARSDVWALGVVLYEMVSGSRPFVGQTAFEITSAILNKPPAPLPSKVPMALRAVIERCLEKNPQDRYATAGKVSEELESIAKGEASASKVVMRRVLRRPLRLAVIAIVLLFAIGIGFNMNWIRGRLAGFATLSGQSIAVLPLANLSGDPQQDFLADSITDALITDLGRFQGLKRIIGRGSVMQYKGTAKSHRDIAKELNVDLLITGTVTRSQNQMRVSVQLIDPTSGDQLWSDSYERALNDVLQLQGEIVSDITQQLRLKMSPEDRARLARTGKVDPEAYEYYVKGMIDWYKHTPEDVEQAYNYFDLALKRDPSYAAAYRGMNYVLTYRLTAGGSPSDAIKSLQDLNQQMKDRGLQEDPNAPEYLESTAVIAYYWGWDWATAESNFKKVVTARPNSVDLKLFYWHYLAAMKRIPEAGAVIERCLELDPYNAFAQGSYGLFFIAAQRFDDAIKQFKKLLTDKIDFGVSHLGLWTAYHHNGMFREALDEAKASFADDEEMLETLAEGFKENGYKGAMLRSAELLQSRSRLTYTLPTNIARIYVYAGENEKAMELLEMAYDERDSGLVMMQIDPDWNTLRSSPRFQALMQRMKFPA